MLSGPNTEALDDFLGLIKQAAPKSKDELRGTQKRELELWHKWNNNGRKPEDLRPLWDSHRPLVESAARVYKNRTRVATSAIDSEYQKHWVNAVKTYDPKRNTQLNTWVQTQLKKGGRYVKTYQNIGRISEKQQKDITTFKEARAHLTDKFGFEPDTHTLADHLGWSPRRTGQLQRELSRDDKPVSGFQHDPGEYMTSKEHQAVFLVQYDQRLSSQERAVFEYTHGLNGRASMQPGEIAKKLDIHPSKVSRIRKKLQGIVLETYKAL